MSLSPLGGHSSVLSAQVQDIRTRMNRLERQLATGKKADTYGELGMDRTVALATRGHISALESYRDNADKAMMRLDFVQTSLGSIAKTIEGAQHDVRTMAYTLNTDGQTVAQTTGHDRLSETLSLLNSDIGGTYLFAGRAADRPPVESTDHILDGDGARAGLKQLISERRQADLGASGRGRLVIPAVAGAAVSLSEDVAGSPFGLKLKSITNNLANATAAGPAGSPPSMSITFGPGQPDSGDTVTVAFTLPDGSEETLTLTATTASPPAAGEFLIGATEAVTATNFQSRLTAMVEDLAATSLRAASAMQASEEFFSVSDSEVPKRVDGPPFDTATALKSATKTDTVFWYTGDMSGDARQSVLARIDDGYTLAYGTRANEQPLRDGLKNMAVLAVETFDAGDEREQTRYEAMKQRVGDGLDFKNRATVTGMQAELGLKQGSLESVKTTHEQALGIANELLASREDADMYETGIRLMHLQTLLQASYQTTASLSRLTLVNYL